MSDAIYDRQYFIDKFEGIPDEHWCTGQLEYEGKHCVLGFCGVTQGKDEYVMTAEAIALCDLIATGSAGRITQINDRYSGKPTPRARILAALRAIPEEARNA